MQISGSGVEQLFAHYVLGGIARTSTNVHPSCSRSGILLKSRYNEACKTLAGSVLSRTVQMTQKPPVLGYNAIHTYLGVSSIKRSGAYFWVVTPRMAISDFVLFDLWGCPTWLRSPFTLSLLVIAQTCKTSLQELSPATQSPPCSEVFTHPCKKHSYSVKSLGPVLLTETDKFVNCK